MKSPSLAVLVRFKSTLPLDEVMRIARERADDFRALGGLQQKYYLHDPTSGEVGGLYLWDSPDDLEAYSESELRSTIAEAYRVQGEPKVEVFRVEMTLRSGGS